jgi:hypothetical protein
MKILFKTILAVVTSALFLTACNKVDDLQTYSNGMASTLTASSQTLAATAADSLTDLVTFNWTNSNYSTAQANHKYIIQIDSVGRSFSHAYSREVMGALTTTFTAKEINDILLGFGFSFNVAYSIEARVISSYGNNNERYYSSPIAITATPYKIPPAVALPFTNHLYIVGGATDFGWNNANPMPPVRELTRMDETTWAGIFHLSGSSAYLLLPEAGSWSNKYSVQDNSIPGAANAGSFGYNLPQDIPGSVAQGDNWYKMIFDFQIGRYTVTKVNNALGQDLYITGDATPSSWTNSPPPSQRFTCLTNGVFEITMAFVPGKVYKFLNTNGQWQPQFGGDNATGGDLGANYGGGNDPAAIPTPAVAGNYKVTVNFLTNKYTVTPL